MAMPYEWTKEKLRKKTKNEIKEVRKNAKNRPDIAKLCDDILADFAAEQRVGNRSVTQFHFVCREGENKYVEGVHTVTGKVGCFGRPCPCRRSSRRNCRASSGEARRVLLAGPNCGLATCDLRNGQDGSQG